ncbi:hypothetical protein GCM10010302_23710 [Streptomyces polychromogenes]|uniref:Uncharacterized protein n=1 Tax=Streptomyces polychromogenes TaxID=67342 RepID=A0ABP3EYM6_9ACTN
MTTNARHLVPLLAAALVIAGSASLAVLSPHHAPRTTIPTTGATTGTGPESWTGPAPSPGPGPDLAPFLKG